ncbi:hypothetical protein LTR66_004363 [Elasticomyces elasticus]|nr:hypothetical protein LTR66_004363 [Elasticomyces elasticus]
MSEAGMTAYITGGASGIGRAVTLMHVVKGTKVFIADRDLEGAKAFASELNEDKSEDVAFAVKVDVTDWDQQLAAFEKVVAQFGRLDYVYPIAGIAERAWLPTDLKAQGFVKPDLTVLDADLNGVLWTISLAVQQFRRQEKNKNGFRGKIGCVASVCGFYCVPTLPVYTAAKHAVNGFVRSYGKYLPEEGITLNAVCPNVIRTNISSGAFYDKLEEQGLLTPMDGVVEAYESMLGSSDVSGELFEVGPKGGYKTRPAQEYLDEPSEKVCELLYHRAHPLQQPK